MAWAWERDWPDNYSAQNTLINAAQITSKGLVEMS
jgi:hypothetical protein